MAALLVAAADPASAGSATASNDTGRQPGTTAPPSSAPEARGPNSAVEAERWYGGPAVITEVSALGLLAVGGYIQNRSALAASDLGKDLAVLATAAWILGPPINHLANGHTRTAFGSLGLRVGALVVPVTLGLLLAKALNHGSVLCAGDPAPTDCSGVPAAIIVLGGLGSIIAVSAVDDSKLAMEPAPPREASRPLLIPGVRVSQRQALLSLTGAF
jgi:hypothetical protein